MDGIWCVKAIAYKHSEFPENPVSCASLIRWKCIAAMAKKQCFNKLNEAMMTSMLEPQYGWNSKDFNNITCLKHAVLI